MARALDQIYQLGVTPDWWKLPPPDAEGWAAIEPMIEKHDPHCRGVLLLGLEASMETLARSFADAAGHSWCKGFAIGRSIFADTTTAWFAGQLDNDGAVAAMAQRYAELIRLWREHAPR